MSHAPKAQTKIDAYLMSLRRALGSLPPDQVEEILREIRGHILERSEAAGELDERRLVEILKALGRPEDIAPLYEAEALLSRARASWSPLLLLRGALRWAMGSLAGFAAFIVGLSGYGAALALWLCALLKPFMPRAVGLWWGGGIYGFGVADRGDPAAELLGWWLIPVALALGAGALVLTTRALRLLLRFARFRPAVG
jgi:hypothetical protein